MILSMDVACDIAKRYYSEKYHLTPNEVLGLYNTILEKRYIFDDGHAYELLQRYIRTQYMKSITWQDINEV